VTPSTLIVPVENQARELDPKLLLAAVAAERGLPVVLGSRAFIHYALHRLPRGVYLAKSMRRLSERMFSIARDLGHEIVALDEEALVHAPPDAYFERRLSAGAVRQVSHLLCWGPENAELFERFPACRTIPIHVTGNPRTDLLRPELRGYHDAEVARIRAEHGDFILFNSSFGTVNAFVDAIRETGERESANAPGAFATGRAAHRRALFEHCVAMLPVLADAFSERTIVVRPHPSERHEAWQAIAREHPNVRVTARGSALPWLIAARVIVHNGCTTGLEGTLLDRPVIAYRPVVSERYDEHLPNSLSHSASSVHELVDLVGRVLAGRLGPYDAADRHKTIEYYLEAMDGPLASDRIVDVLVEAGYLARPPQRAHPLARARGVLHNTARTALKRWNRRRPGHRGSAAYHDHRFPPLDAEELAERLARLRRLLGRFEDVRVRERAPHLFDVSSPSS
jgi:surface carbohydrate biosynthesis protein